MGDSSYSYVVAFDASQIADAVFVLRSAGQDAQCGFPGCAPTSYTCAVNPHFLPDELNGIMSVEELRELTDKINKMMLATCAPPLPLIFTHFCIPFSPFCVMAHYAAQRQNLLHTALAEASVKLIPKGYYWESMIERNLNHGYIAQLKVNKTAAAAYRAQQETGGDVPAASVSTGYAAIATMEVETHAVPALAVMYRDQPNK